MIYKCANVSQSVYCDEKKMGTDHFRCLTLRPISLQACCYEYYLIVLIREKESSPCKHHQNFFFFGGGGGVGGGGGGLMLRTKSDIGIFLKPNMLLY